MEDCTKYLKKAWIAFIFLLGLIVFSILFKNNYIPEFMKPYFIIYVIITFIIMINKLMPYGSCIERNQNKFS